MYSVKVALPNTFIGFSKIISYVGGRAWSDSYMNGEGGWSWIAEHAMFKEVKPGFHYGAGTVVIIQAVAKGCDCSYLCVAMDEARTIVKCVCPTGKSLSHDGRTCSGN